MSESPPSFTYPRRNPQRPAKRKIELGAYNPPKNPEYGLSNESSGKEEGETSPLAPSSLESASSRAEGEIESEVEIEQEAESESESEKEVTILGSRRRKATITGSASMPARKKAKTGKGKGRASIEDEVEVRSREEKLRIHRDVMTSAIRPPASMITVIVGPRPASIAAWQQDPASRQSNSFYIHKELFALHCNLFATNLASIRDENKSCSIKKTGASFLRLSSEPTQPTPEEYFTFPDANAVEFAAFMSWMYSGETSESTLDLSLENDYGLESWWVTGAKLQSPGFQNCILDDIRELATRDVSWPSAKEARKVFELTAGEGKKDNLLRKFTTHCIAANSPFQRYEVGSEEYVEWERLFGENSELSMRVLKVGGKSWVEGGMPWDEHLRTEYVVEVTPLQQRLNTLKDSTSQSRAEG